DVFFGPMPTQPNGEPWVTPKYRHAPKDRVEMAPIRHVIWIGGRLVEDVIVVNVKPRPGPKSRFRRKAEESAERLRGKLTTVLWTDLDRRVVEYAVEHPNKEFYQSDEQGDELLDGTDLVEVRSVLKWAGTDISVIDWREVYNIENPHPLQRL